MFFSSKYGNENCPVCYKEFFVYFSAEETLKEASQLTLTLILQGSCLASLSLLVVIHSTWFILENTVLDKYVRYRVYIYFFLDFLFWINFFPSTVMNFFFALFQFMHFELFFLTLFFLRCMKGAFSPGKSVQFLYKNRMKLFIYSCPLTGSMQRLPSIIIN